MKKTKVLVIEDEWTIAQNTKETLENLNYHVPAMAATGEQAIQKAVELQPDLVLMDILLSGEMDGIEAAQQIQNRCNIPVVFLSAYSDSKTVQRVNATHPYGYLVKPWAAKTLNTTIQSALSRHKATVELRSQLAAILDSSNDAVIGEMLDGIIVGWNAGAEKIFGYWASEAIARSISILIPPNCANEMPQLLKRIERGEKIEHYETVRMRKDGQLIDVSVTIAPLKDTTGNIIGVSEVVRDLTEGKRTGRLLQQQQSLLSNLIEGTNDSIAALDLDFRYIAFNRAYKSELLQIAGREIEIGTSLIEAIAHLSPEEQAKIMARWRRALAGEEFIVIEGYTNLSGQHHYYEITCSSIRDSQGQLMGASQMSKNVTERIRAEQALQQSEQRFRNAFDYTAVGMAMSNLDGCFFKVNPAFCRMLGYSEAELLRMNFQAITHPDDLDSSLSHLEQVLAGEIGYFHLEKRYLHKQGHNVWVILSVSLVRDEFDQPLYFIAQIQDISDRKQAEQSLHKSESLLKQAQSIAHIGNWEYDVNAQKSTWSEEIFRIFGLDSTESEPNYSGVMQLFHPVDGEKYHQLVQQALAHGTPYNADLRVYRSDGSLGWLNLRGEAATDRQGRVIRLLGTAQDITERKQAEEQFQQAHQKITFLIQNTPLGVIEWDSQFRVSRWSQRAEEIFGWQAEDVLGKTMHEWRFIFEDDFDYVNQLASGLSSQL
ncbi:MAG TPA: PAS domain S-box protein [Stenomitos sp.]